MTGPLLDIQHPELGSLADLIPDGDTDAVLAQLIVDRCRELSELLTCYQRALHPPSPNRPDPDDFDLPF